MFCGCLETLLRASITAAARRRTRYILGCHDAAIHTRLYGPKIFFLAPTDINGQKLFNLSLVSELR